MMVRGAALVPTAGLEGRSALLRRARGAAPPHGLKGKRTKMRQLTSLDAQFLALEDGRNLGHVSGLAIYDPSTAPGGVLDAAAPAGARRRAPAPAAAVPLAPRAGAVRARPPVLDRRRATSTSATTCASSRCRRPASDAAARRAGRADLRPPARSRAPAVGALRHPRPARRPRRGDDEDPPLGRRRPVRRRDPRRAARPAARRAATCRRPRAGAASAAPSELEMLARGLAGLPRQPVRLLRNLPKTLANLDALPTLRHIPGAPVDRLDDARRRARALPAPHRRRRARGPQRCARRARAFRPSLSPHRRVGWGSVSLTDVKAVKNAFGCTVNDVVMTMCASAMRVVPDRARRAAGRAARDDGAGLGPHARSSSAPSATASRRWSSSCRPTRPTRATRLERMSRTMASAKERHKALPATILQDANHVIPPALLARAARVTARIAVTRGLEAPLNLIISNVPGSPLPLYLRGREARGAVPDLGDHRRLGAQHHAAQLPRPARLRRRLRPGDARRRVRHRRAARARARGARRADPAAARRRPRATARAARRPPRPRSSG